MFKGEYSHSMDAKGRLIIPSKLRDRLGDSFVVTRGLDGCLFVFDSEGWESFEKKLNALPMDISGARTLQRFFVAGAVDAEVDRQGRFLLTAPLLKHAAIEKEAVIAGVGGHVEIWSRERWAAVNCFEDIDSIAARMSEYGLSI